jgi:transcriptional regulator with XRE-family HTH domain
MDTFGERLRAELERKQWRPSRLAAKLGVPASTVSRWLGGRSTPRSIYLTQIAQALDVSEELLLSGNGKIAGGGDTQQSPGIEPGAAILLADEDMQRALGVFPLTDEERIFIGGLYFRGRLTEPADAATWCRKRRAFLAWTDDRAGSVSEE